VPKKARGKQHDLAPLPFATFVVRLVVALYGASVGLIAGLQSDEVAHVSMSSSISEQVPLLLDVVSLSKRYGDQPALIDVHVSMRTGEVLGLIGPNGAGKTTLLESVAGLLPVDAGSVIWRGQELSAPMRREAVFYLPDGVRLYGDQFVVHVLNFFGSVYRRSAEEISSATSAVSLEPALAKRVGSLSKGYNRRLIIAVGLLTRQPILLMDEPFDGFDLRQTRDMMLVLRRVAAGGRSLLLSIHQLANAEQVCDRIALIADGRIREVGTPGELRARAGRPMANLEEVFLALT
jgi:ABC-type multidrug transport system ATPase subunit